MTDFSLTWSDGIERRFSNPRWAVSVMGFLSVAVHCVVLYLVLPYVPARVSVEASSGRVSLQLVSRPAPSAPLSNPRPTPPPVEKLHAVVPPIMKEIVKDVPPPDETQKVVVQPEPLLEPVIEPTESIEVGQVERVAMVEPATNPVESVTEPAVEAPGVQSSDATPVIDAPATDVMPASGHVASAAEEMINAHPAYSHNPKPEYPITAQRLWQQGKVVLRVWVSESGTVERLSVDKSSGFRILDASAERAVRLWKFVPARRGAINESSVCLVPITFNLTRGVEIE